MLISSSAVGRLLDARLLRGNGGGMSDHLHRRMIESCKWNVKGIKSGRKKRGSKGE